MIPQNQSQRTTPKVYRNLTCCGCGKKMTKSIKPQGEAKCRPCLQPNAKAKDLVCQYCNETFKSIVHADYCSRTCYDKVYELSNKKPCIECGSLVDLVADRCRKCAAVKLSKDTAEHRAQQRIKREEQDHIRKEIMSKLCKPKVLCTGQCIACDKLWGSFTKHTRLCKQCKLTRFKARKRSSRARRRAYMRGAYTESFKVDVVFERDNYICLICNEPMDMDAMVPQSLAPTIDHIKPISLGGDHTVSNCRSAHFICNATRGNEYNEELDIAIG